MLYLMTAAVGTGNPAFLMVCERQNLRECFLTGVTEEDAVVLDDQMPGMNGDVVAAKMKRAKSHVPIMLLSSYGPLPKSKLEAVDTFLSKSQPPKILLSTLQDLLNRRPRPFFSRWFDTWRSRNEGVRQ